MWLESINDMGQNIEDQMYEFRGITYEQKVFEYSLPNEIYHAWTRIRVAFKNVLIHAELQRMSRDVIARALKPAELARITPSDDEYGGLPLPNETQRQFIDGPDQRWIKAGFLRAFHKRTYENLLYIKRANDEAHEKGRALISAICLLFTDEQGDALERLAFANMESIYPMVIIPLPKLDISYGASSKQHAQDPWRKSKHKLDPAARIKVVNDRIRALRWAWELGVLIHDLRQQAEAVDVTRIFLAGYSLGGESASLAMLGGSWVENMHRLTDAATSRVSLQLIVSAALIPTLALFTDSVPLDDDTKHVDAAVQAVCEGSSWTACTIRAAITQLALPGDSILEMWLTDSLIVLGGNDIHTKYFTHPDYFHEDPEFGTRVREEFNRRTQRTLLIEFKTATHTDICWHQHMGLLCIWFANYMRQDETVFPITVDGWSLNLPDRCKDFISDKNGCWLNPPAATSEETAPPIQRSSRSSKKKRKHVPYAIELVAMSAIAKHLNHVVGDCVLRRNDTRCACGQTFTSHNDYVQHVKSCLHCGDGNGSAQLAHEFERLLTDLTQTYYKNQEAWKVKTSDGVLRELDIDYLDSRGDLQLRKGASIAELRKIIDQIPPWRTWLQSYRQRLNQQDIKLDDGAPGDTDTPFTPRDGRDVDSTPVGSPSSNLSRDSTIPRGIVLPALTIRKRASDEHSNSSSTKSAKIHEDHESLIIDTLFSQVTQEEADLHMRNHWAAITNIRIETHRMRIRRNLTRAQWREWFTGSALHQIGRDGFLLAPVSYAIIKCILPDDWISDADDSGDHIADDEFLAPLLKAFLEVEARLTEISNHFRVSLRIPNEPDTSERAPSTARSVHVEGDSELATPGGAEPDAERAPRRSSRVISGGDNHPSSKGPTATMRDVPRAVKARDAIPQNRPDTGQPGQSEQPAPRVVVQPGKERTDANVEGERVPSGVKGEKHIHGSVKPADCSEEDWQKEQDRRKRQAEHDRQKAQGTSQGKGSAARLTPANPAVAAENNAVQLIPASPAVTAARARAAARVEQQRGKGGNDRATPYWKPRDRGGRKP